MKFKAFLRWIRRHPVWSGLLALLLGFILYKVVAPTKPDYEYVAVPVERGEVTRIVSASGKIRALNTIKVGSEVSGQVSQVFVDYNSTVAAGQPLAQIDPTRLRARVTQAEAQVQLARAALVQSQAALTRARTDIGVQTRDFGRRKELAERGFTSKAGLDQSPMHWPRHKAASTARLRASLQPVPRSGSGKPSCSPHSSTSAARASWRRRAER
jgi:HlyD family secretion protein